MPALRLLTALGACALALCLSLLLPGTAQAAAQDPTGRLLFQSYGRESGLGSLRINLLVQDQQGFIWAGTDRGLYRFDGQRFRAFGLAQGLPSLEINALALDARGQLWVGSSGGLSRWNGQRFVPADGVPLALKVNDLSLGPGEQLWAATSGGPWVQTDAGWQARPLPGNVLPEALAHAATPGTADAPLWAATRDQLWIWQAASGWKPAALQVPLARGERLDRLAVAGDGSLFVRSSRASYRAAPGATAVEPLPAVVRAEIFLSRMAADGQGGLWLPTEHGLSRWQAGRFTHWGLADGLPTEFARAVLVDREGGLWVGSLGLHRLLGLGAWRTHTAKQGLPADVWSVLRDRSGQLWAGTGKGLARGAGAAGWQLLPGTEGHTVRALLQEPSGALLFGGEPMGLLRWDGKRLSVMDDLPEDGRKLMALSLDADDQLWVGTQRAGLLRGVRDGERWRFTREALDGVNRVNDLRLDARGRLWVATNAGLFLRSGSGWQRYGRADGLLAEHVLYLGASSRGDALWLAYRDVHGAVTHWGLGASGGQVLRHLQPPLLPAQDITLLGEDADARLWVGGNQGLEMLSEPRALQPPATVHFGVERGLVDEEANARAFWADRDGMLWFGTRGGLAQFDSRRFVGDPRQLRVELLEASLGDRPLPLRADASAPLRVSHRDNVLQVGFASLSFTDPAGVGYQARLVGLEPEWHDAGTRELRYPGLTPGSYRLELRARYRQGEWGPVTALDFVVEPPWWQTTLFRFALGSGLLLAFIGWRKQQLRRHRRETARLQALVAERTEALAQANAALREQSFTDPLTGLRNRRFMEEAMREHAALAQRTRSNPRGAPGLVLMLLDVDHFKAVNDTHGHAAGDAVLVQMAQRLRACTRESDLLVRWGGEEFAIAAHAGSLAQGTQLAERIRAAVAGQDFDLGGGATLPVRCSLGVVPFPWSETAPAAWPWQRLMELADACLYLAKRSGRNRWVAAQPTAQFAAEPGPDLAAELPGWVRSGQVAVLSGDDAPVRWD